jgi:hypothetical protein
MGQISQERTVTARLSATVDTGSHETRAGEPLTMVGVPYGGQIQRGTPFP